MPKKTRASKTQLKVQVGNISNISGIVNIACGNTTMHQTTTGLSAADIEQLFDPLYKAIETNAKTSPADQEELKAEVKEIQSTGTEAARNNEKVDKGFLSSRFRNIARMAPDVLDVVVATLGSPLARLGVAVKRIAEKAKEEIKEA